MLWSAWWIWMAGALVLGILEVLIPAFVFLGFSIGAGVIGLILLLGGTATGALTGSLPLLLVVYAVVSLVSWIVLRRVLGVRKGQVKIIEHDINQ